ncbi:MAG: Clp protease N-terminal domain-containing protein, partial [Alphaproteobacteria bacterium]
MDLQKLTEKSLEGLRGAQGLAVRRNHQGVDVEHLAAALLDDENGLARTLVERAGGNPKAARDA